MAKRASVTFGIEYGNKKIMIKPYTSWLWNTWEFGPGIYFINGFEVALMLGPLTLAIFFWKENNKQIDLENQLKETNEQLKREREKTIWYASLYYVRSLARRASKNETIIGPFK